MQSIRLIFDENCVHPQFHPRGKGNCFRPNRDNVELSALCGLSFSPSGIEASSFCNDGSLQPEKTYLVLCTATIHLPFDWNTAEAVTPHTETVSSTSQSTEAGNHCSKLSDFTKWISHNSSLLDFCCQFLVNLTASLPEGVNVIGWVIYIPDKLLEKEISSTLYKSLHMFLRSIHVHKFHDTKLPTLDYPMFHVLAIQSASIPTAYLAEFEKNHAEGDEEQYIPSLPLHFYQSETCLEIASECIFIKNVKNVPETSVYALKLFQSNLSVEFFLTFESDPSVVSSLLSSTPSIPISSLPSAGRMQLKTHALEWQKLLLQKEALRFYDPEAGVGFSENTASPESNSLWRRCPPIVSATFPTLPTTYLKAFVCTSPASSHCLKDVVPVGTASLCSLRFQLQMDTLVVLPLEKITATTTVYQALRASFWAKFQHIRDAVDFSLLADKQEEAGLLDVVVASPPPALAWPLGLSQGLHGTCAPPLCTDTPPATAVFPPVDLYCLQLHFRLFAFSFSLLPLCLHSIASKIIRKAWLDVLELPYRPVFVPSAALPSFPSSARATLINPHAMLAAGPKWIPPLHRALHLVQGMYEYFHYDQDDIQDTGWGCCYRSLQTSISWFRLQHYTDKPIPSHWDIQKLLKEKDLAHRDLEIGKQLWIGTVEGQYVFNWYLSHECKIIYLVEASDISAHTSRLCKHFDTQGTPIMMGVGTMAYTLVGICRDTQTEEVAYLIVDPHYNGPDVLKAILQKNWIAWKKVDFFKKTAGGKFVNLCCPQIFTEDGQFVY